MITAASTAVVLATPALAASPPAPVASLSLSSRDAVVYADWTPSPDTSSAVVCWQQGSAPATPQDAGATCSDPTTTGGFSFAAAAGTSYGVSVFSYDTGTATYGPPASGTVLAVDDPPSPPINLASIDTTSDEHVLYLRWGDNPANGDTADFVVDWAVGTAAPAFDAGSGHVTTSTGLTVTGLTGGVVYTFAVYVRDAGGNVSQPAVLRAATRSTGLFLRSWDARGSGVVSRAITDDVSAASSQMNSDGHLRVLYVRDGALVYQSRESGSSWGTTSYRAYEQVGVPYLGAPATGNALIATWNTRTGIHDEVRGASGWSADRALTTHGVDRVLGAVRDGTRSHVLFRRSSGSTRGLWYATIAAGRVTKTRISGAGGTDSAAMTRDEETGNVVIVDRHRSASGNVLRVAVLAPAATVVPAMRTWRTTKLAVDLRPTSVASDSGAITIGLQRVTTGGSSLDGPYVVHGTATGHAAPTRVAGTTSRDVHMVVTALQPNHVVVSWRRTSGSWSPSSIGVWTTQWTRSASGSWRFAAAVRRSTSAYDDPVASYRDDAGHFYVLYRTGDADVTE